MDLNRNQITRYCAVALVSLVAVHVQRAAGQTCAQCNSAACYGVTVDTDGNIWCTGFADPQLTRFPPGGDPLGVEVYPTGIAACDQGIAVTPADNHVWEAHSRLQYGQSGGGRGCKGRNLLRRRGTEPTEELGPIAHVVVERGDRLIVETPGGGGFGSGP